MPIFAVVMHNNNGTRKKNKFAIPALAVITAVMLLAASAAITVSTTQNVFAYESNQANSDINECGNGALSTNVGCQNIDSQIQGDKNTVALSAEQRFPSPPSPPDTCEECFTALGSYLLR
jgi:hypothetical protein